MTRFAVIVDGSVFTVTEADAPLAGNWVECGDSVAVGDLWDGNAFSKPAPVVIVPEVVLMSSARKVLRRNGFTDAVVRAAIAQIVDEDEREEALIDWEFHPTVRKSSPLVAKVAPLLQLTPAQIDAMLVEAGGIE